MRTAELFSCLMAGAGLSMTGGCDVGSMNCKILNYPNKLNHPSIDFAAHGALNHQLDLFGGFRGQDVQSNRPNAHAFASLRRENYIISIFFHSQRHATGSAVVVVLQELPVLRHMNSSALLNQFLMVIRIAWFTEWPNVAGEEADATMLGAGQFDGQDLVQFVARDHKDDGI